MAFNAATATRVATRCAFLGSSESAPTRLRTISIRWTRWREFIHRQTMRKHRFGWNPLVSVFSVQGAGSDQLPGRLEIGRILHLKYLKSEISDWTGKPKRTTVQ